MQERSFPTNFLEMRVNQSNPSRIIWTIFAISLDEALLVDRFVNEIKRERLQDWPDRRSEVRETRRNG